MSGPSRYHAGQLIGGKYTLDNLIARGGMGLVYAARHSETGRAVAVKVLRPELVTRSDLVRRVSTEARLAVEAAHPNVVEVLDAGADDEGVPYVVLERLHGSSLDVFLASPIPLLPTVQVLVPISSALVSLHEAGIVHRDIKPSNLFLSRRRDGRITPKLLDFGIAKALEAMGTTLSGAALGTPAYMAPEQALGLGGAGPPTDIWSLAVVFVRCLTGRFPFETLPQGRLGSLRAGLQPADLAGVPEPLSRVLVRALRFDPAERFATMAEFRATLLDALHEVNPNERWPRVDTVAYAASESELSNWLGALSPEETSPVDEASPSHRRPLDVETKTLPGVQTATSSPPGQGRAWLAGRVRYLPWIVAAGSFAGVAVLVLEARSPRAPRAGMELVPPSAEPAERVGPESIERRDGTGPDPAVRETATPPAVISELRPEPRETLLATSSAQTARAGTRRPPDVVRPSHSQSASPNNAPEPATDRSSSKLTVGANRAPIIE